MILETCDIILLKNKKSIIAELLGVFQADPVNYGHIAICVNSEFAIEAKHSIQESKISDLLLNATKYKVIRYSCCTEEKNTKVVKLLRVLKGLRYGWLRFFLLILDQIFGTRWFTKLLKNNKNQICSSLVAYAFYVVYRVSFNSVDWRSCEPDDIDDESLKSIKWLTITIV